MAGINLFLNRNNTRGVQYGLVRSATDLSPVQFPTLVVGDSASFSLKITAGDSDGTLESLTGYSIRLGIGDPGAEPTGGTFTVTDGTDTTSALAYNVTATALETALNALNTSTGPFGDTVTVSGSDGGPYKVTFDTNGAQTSLSVTTTALTPESGGSVSELTAGDGSTQEVQSIKLYRQPIVLVTDWTIADTVATASVNLTSYGLYQLVADDSDGRLPTKCELEITDASGNVATLAQVNCAIIAEVLPNGAGASSLNSADFASQAYVDARVNLVKLDSGDTADYLTNKVANSVVVTAGDTLELDGDETTPQAHSFYGVDESSNRAWDHKPGVATLLYLEKNHG